MMGVSGTPMLTACGYAAADGDDRFARHASADGRDIFRAPNNQNCAWFSPGDRHMSFVIVLLVAAMFQAAPAAPHQVTTSGQSKVGYFEAHEDVGSPAIAGATVYDPKAQTYTITGAGVNMWG